MTPEMYRQAGDLFEEIRKLPDAERSAAVDAACAGNPELRAQVLRLLEAEHESADSSFLEGRAIAHAARLLIPELPSSGTVIGNFRLGSRIGLGGMGVVYEAEDLHLHRRVVVKILPLGFAGQDEDRIHRFQREARAASTLNHPNIVSIFDAGFDQGWHYISMEFVEGKTLRELRASASRPLDDRTILDLISQVAAALSAAHEAGIVHRDIKPENIMVRPDGIVKVLDFGLAKIREASPDLLSRTDLRTRPGGLAGTIQYLSPEQILGEPAGPLSDLFSVGVVAYELSTGVRPFDGPTDGAIFDAILNRIPRPPSAVRPTLGNDLDRVIMRALEKDPELRFQTARDLRSLCRIITRDHIAKPLESGGDVSHWDSVGQPGNSSPVGRTGEWASGTPSGGASAAIGARTVPAQPARHRRPRTLAALAGLTAALGVAFFLLTRTESPPRATQIVQITTDGRTKQRMVNDGTRLYYAAGGRDPDMKMFQVNLKGGDPMLMPRLAGMLPLDISPDHSEILLGQTLKGKTYQGTIDGPFPIWVADVLGNAPRRLGDLSAQEVRWSPGGDRILYSNGPELRIARSDGSQSRTVTTMKGDIRYPQWSPDGRSIRFTLNAENSRMLWEVAPEGTNLHAVFPEWADYAPEFGVWTPDGKYFVFTAGRRGVRDLWALRQSGRLFAPTPVRLTTGPMKAELAEAGADGRRIFFLGTVNYDQLVRYERKSDRWTPYFGGLAAMQLDFSRDGKWAAYAHCPEGSVWRIALDGGERLQLTASPLFALNPRWSPDGTQLTFSGGRPGEPARLFVVPSAGGAARQLTHGANGSTADDDGNWSPDGASIIFGATFGDPSVDVRQRLALESIDVKTQQISKLPGSEGLWSPRWSPDGRYIAAMGFPNRLWLYNVETRALAQLTTIGAGWPCWSRDSGYIYFEENPGTDWYRVRIKDRKMERVMSLTGLKMSIPSVGWVGLAPDGSPISTRDAGGTEIYALEWEAP